MEDLKNESNKQFNIILAVSALAFAFLVWLIYFKAPTQVNDQGAIVMVMLLPKINAFLNGLCTIALIVGYIFIKNGNKSAHIKSMMMAFVFSSLFLIGYILYHTFHGETKFIAQGTIRPIYFFILISHIILSAATLPMALMTFYLGIKSKFERHKKWARWTFPIWLYVSITGVVIFAFLEFLNK